MPGDQPLKPFGNATLRELIEESRRLREQSKHLRERMADLDNEIDRFRQKYGKTGA